MLCSIGWPDGSYSEYYLSIKVSVHGNLRLLGRIIIPRINFANSGHPNYAIINSLLHRDHNQVITSQAVC